MTPISNERTKPGLQLILGMIRHTRRSIGVALVLSPALLFGQISSGGGSKSYAAKCAGCHGADARGTDRGPGLAGSRRLRARSTDQLRALIQKGVPASGMPAFDLPARELDALAALVHSLNAPAAEGAGARRRQGGRAILSSAKGNCASCHMVQGRGAAVGPDLSDVGTRLTVEEIRESLLQPGARIAAGYELVTVQLRDGRSLRGFVRSRSNFDLHLQDLAGPHSLAGEGPDGADRA